MDTLQVIDKLHAFYSDAFSQLIILTIAIWAFSGVVLPIIIQLIQSRSSRVQQRSLEAHISQEVATARNELNTAIKQLFQTEKENLDSYLEEKTASLKASLQEEISVAKGGIFVLQAGNFFREKKYAQAARDYAYAADHFLHGKDDQNAQRTLTSLTDECIRLLDSSSFDKVPQIERAFDALLKLLEKRNENDRFTDTISSITVGLSRAKKRTPPAQAG